MKNRIAVRDIFRLGRHYLWKFKRDVGNAIKIVGARSLNPGALIGSDVRILGIADHLSIGSGSIIEDGALLDFRFGGSIILGKNVTVRSGAILAPFGGFIRIGKESGVNHYTVLYGHGGLTIGEYVRFAAHCLVIPANHSAARRDVPIYSQPLTKKGIVIADDVWVGAHSVILDGVSIGGGSVIAAGSVVTKTIEPLTIAAGVPAKPIRTR